eukprot:1546761-Amphidinium_carterae.1
MLPQRRSMAGKMERGRYSDGRVARGTFGWSFTQTVRQSGGYSPVLREAERRSASTGCTDRGKLSPECSRGSPSNPATVGLVLASCWVIHSGGTRRWPSSG